MSDTRKLWDLYPIIHDIDQGPYYKWLSAENNIPYYRYADEFIMLEEYNIEYFDSIPQFQRVLCYLLWQNSCLAFPCDIRYPHHNNKEEAKKLFNAIKHEEMEIRKHGLPIYNPLTKENALFLDETYRIPWNSFQEFIEKYPYSNDNGLLMFMVHKEDKQICETFKHNEYSHDLAKFGDVKELANNEVFYIKTERGDVDELEKEEWIAITEYVGSVLGAKKCNN